MADQASTETTPQAGDNTGAQQPEQASAQVAPAANAAETDKIIQSLRKENAERRVREKELADKLKGFEDARLSEDEKRAKRIKELEEAEGKAANRANELELRLAVERTARRIGIVDEEAAFSLMDKSKISYEGGRLDVSSVEAELKALLAARSWLKAKTMPETPVVPATNPSKQSPNTLSIADIRAMSQVEINARWDEVQKVLGNGK